VSYSCGYGMHAPADGTNNLSMLLGAIDPWDLVSARVFTPRLEYGNRYKDSEGYGWVGGFSLPMEK
jgi:hypothetical protein